MIIYNDNEAQQNFSEVLEQATHEEVFVRRAAKQMVMALPVAQTVTKVILHSKSIYFTSLKE